MKSMTYFKSLIFNFLTVFFVNHVIPGIKIAYYTKLPHIEGEFIFAAILGFLNSLIFPVLHLFKLRPSHFKIGLISFIVSFGSYSIVNLFPLGVKVTTPGSYIWSGLVVWFASYLTNHLEFRQHLREIERELEGREEGDKEKKKSEKKGSSK